MSAQANYFKLGLFVIVATFILIAGVITLGVGALFEKKIHFETYMAQSVEGLSAGAAVKFKGVKIGSVEDITFARFRYEPDFIQKGRMGDFVLVEVALDARHYPDISPAEWETWLAKARAAGLRVRVASAGITGPAFLEAVFLDPQLFPEPDLGWTPPPMYVPSAPSTTQVLLSAVEKIARSLEDTDFQGLVADMDTLVNNVDTAIGELDIQKLNDDALGLIEDLQSKIDAIDTQEINDEAVSLLEEVRGSNKRLQDILNDPDIDPAVGDLRATLENAKNASARLNEILDSDEVRDIITQIDQTSADLPPALQDVQRVVRRIDRLIATQQGTIEAILDELERALDNVDSITEDATQNPSRLLFGEPPARTTPGGGKR